MTAYKKRINSNTIHSYQRRMAGYLSTVHCPDFPKVVETSVFVERRKRGVGRMTTLSLTCVKRFVTVHLTK